MYEILFALGVASGIAKAAAAVFSLLREYKQYRRIASDK